MKNNYFGNLLSMTEESLILDENFKKLSISDTKKDFTDAERMLYNQSFNSPPPKQVTFYKDTQHYFKVMEELVKMEFQHEKNSKDKMTQHNVSITWDLNSDEKKVSFSYTHKQTNDDQRGNIDVGDQIILRLNTNEERFFISRTPNLEVSMYTAECLKNRARSLYTLTQSNTGFTIIYSPSKITFERRLEALNNLLFNQIDNKISEYLVEKILGHNIDDINTSYSDFFTSVQPPNIPELDNSQKNALKESIKNCLYLIQGPPGTGKTITLASIIFNLVKHKENTKVLVCAASNKAVDNLAMRIKDTGLYVIRVYSIKQELYGSVIEEISLTHKVNAVIRDVKKEPSSSDSDTIVNLRNILLQRGESELKERLKQRFLDLAHVICCPCTELANKIFKNRHFDTVVFDESTQAFEPDCLIALTKGCKHLIMVGDHCQLGPTILSREIIKPELRLSLFERLFFNNNKMSVLKVQYRMHPSISKFPSMEFYSNQLIDKYKPFINSGKLKFGVYFNWPNPNKPILFIAHNKTEDPLKPMTPSYSNRYEAKQLVSIAINLIKTGFSSEQIGVITFYVNQKRVIENMFKNQKDIEVERLKNLEIASVDSFQGREKEIILISCVRSNNKETIGFLSDPRRLNVSITRAKHGLIIFGNIDCLTSNPLWNKLVDYYLINDLVYYGDLLNLKLYKKIDQKSVFEKDLLSYL